MSDIATNIEHIGERIALASNRARRSSNEIRMMAVSKKQPASAIVEAASHGITLFGENRVQEFATKKDQIPANCRVAMIGHLQSNKARRAAELFDEVHSLDSLDLAERLNAAAQSFNKRLPVLLEIKLSNEAAKTGLLPNSPELSTLLERLPDLASLEAKGLMTVPPWDENAEAARPYFVRLRELREQLARQSPRLNFAELSMGMSNDFEVAIEEGATIVRIGTAIFGKRSYK
jgi:pyridoxal phosphate enzyme (YggS family)